MAPEPPDGNPNNRAEAASRLRRMIADLDQRITRQQRRVEKIIINREGPVDEAKALLDDMVTARDMMKAELAGLEQP
jgi:Fe2+ or Zn2+ uptake regulation protein